MQRKLNVLDYKPQTIFDTIELSDNLKQLALNLKYDKLSKVTFQSIFTLC